MDYQALQARLEALIKLGGWSNAQPPPDYGFLVNEGLRLFTRETQHNIEELTITTVATQATYSIYNVVGGVTDRRDWIAFFDDALYQGTIWISQTTRDQLRVDDRLWRSKPAGQPVWWYWASPTEIGLYPVPSTSSVTVNFCGPRHEPKLVNDTDTPLFNEDFHEGVCLFAAWYWGKLHTRGDERSIAIGYQQEALDYTARYRQTMAAQEASLVVRRVSRSPQEYIGLGSKQQPIFWP